MKKLLDIMLLIFCIGTLVGTSDLVISNLKLILFLFGWFFLLLYTFFILLTTSVFERKSKEEKTDEWIEENIEDPKI